VAISTAQSFIYDPRFHTFDSWAALVLEEFSAQQLAAPTNEKNWKEWAVGLNAISLFNNQAIPDPMYFNDWRDWAAAVMGAFNTAPE
jgi:hypothetical protein